jgi:hypothetical protein
VVVVTGRRVVVVVLTGRPGPAAAATPAAVLVAAAVDGVDVFAGGGPAVDGVGGGVTTAAGGAAVWGWPAPEQAVRATATAVVAQAARRGVMAKSTTQFPGRLSTAGWELRREHDALTTGSLLSCPVAPTPSPFQGENVMLRQQFLS